jgi:hypothetical protein
MVLAGITTLLVETAVHGLFKPWGRRKLAEGATGITRPLAEAAVLA